MKRKVVILGSTGSIGKSLCNILKKDKKNIEICLISADKNINELLKQVKFFNVKNIIVSNTKKFLQIKKLLNKKNINIYNNFDSINKIFYKKKIDYCMNAISGLDGLVPTLKIIKYSKNIAIANKESIICGWSLINKELLKNKTKFIPIDSEHYSIYSLINGLKNHNIDKVYITASGGPFHKLPLKNFRSIKLKEALNHPNWKMGKKITIDSATMMNKVFEIMEAKKIFDLNYSDLNILVHAKSYVHAIVKFKNGLTKILIHDTDMKIPIFNSLYENDNKEILSKKLNFSVINDLNFKEIDLKRFPVVKIIKNLPDKNTLFETIIVTANDELVKMFLNGKIKFIDISRILLKVLKDKEFNKYKGIIPKNIIDILKMSNYVSIKINALDI